MVERPEGSDKDRSDRTSDAAARAARRRAHQRLVQRRRRLAALGVAALAVMAISITTIRVSEIPENTTIAGVDVSGMDSTQARQALADTIQQTMAKRVEFRSKEDPRLDLDLVGAEISSGPDFEAAFEAARNSRGRFGRFLSRFGISGRNDVPLRYVINGPSVTQVTEAAEANLGTRPVPAQVLMLGRRIAIRAGKEGRSVDRELLRRRMAELPDRVEVPIRIDQPTVTTDEARKAADLAEQMRAIGREVTYQGRTSILAPAVVTKALRFSNSDAGIQVGLKPLVLRRALSKPLGIPDRAPQNARWRLEGDRARLIPGKVGAQLDAADLTDQIRSRPTAQTVQAKLVTTPPSRTTADARKLKITERISSFTTPYDCCQNRVINIGRAAQILDSTIIMPGERFSLNDALGERTVARGFVEAPSIEAGEIKPTVGGGVSQVATTLYNAAFFGGLELIAATPHSFYFSRYPRGREATISWREPDLVFRNNWDAAVLISVATSRNAITISMYSSKLGRRVETTSTEPANIVEPKTIERLKPELEPGTEKIVQPKGSPGFSISYTRRVWKGDDLVSDRTFYWTYKPENEIIEMGPPKPDDPEPDDDEDPTGTTPGTTTAGTTTQPATP